MSGGSTFLNELKKRGINTPETTVSSAGGAGGGFLKELNKLKKKEEEIDRASIGDDIGPVKEKEDGIDFFDAGAFSDGYQIGDVTKAILGTVGDVGHQVIKGGVGMVEGVTDLLTYGVAGVSDLVGADAFADKMKKAAQADFTGDTFKRGEEYLDKYSLLGKTSQAVAQGVGQVGTLILTGGAGAAAGLSSAGVSALTTVAMGLSGMGSGMGEAYKGGATDGEAVAYGAISGTADALTEMIFGGLGKGINILGFGKGLSSADDILAKSLSSKIQNTLAKNLVEFGVKASGEGLEEVLAGVAQAAGKKATYMSESDFADIIQDENLLEQFVVGALTSGIAQGGDVYRATKSGRDMVTGLNKNEQAVIDKVYKDELAKAEKDSKLTQKQKDDLYNKVTEQMDKGYISIETIEEVLGEDAKVKDSKTSYDALLKESKEFEELYNTESGKLSKKQQDRLAELEAKNTANPYEKALQTAKEKLSQSVYGVARESRLVASYNEQQRVFDKFTPEYSKYEGTKHADAARKTIDSAIQAGANNTNRVHDLVDMAAHVAADTGKVFTFKSGKQIKAEFVERQTKEIAKLEKVPEAQRTKEQAQKIADMKDLLSKVESGDVIVDGDISGNEIVLNLDSAKPLNRVVGHEITHSFEPGKGKTSKEYTELKDSLFAYAKTKKIDIDAKLKEKQLQYEGVADADPEAELVADLVGDFLFTDSDYVKKLSVENQNLFQRLWDKVKHLYKMATAGSQEARELERVKKAFEDAYRESATKNTAESGVKYSLLVKDKDGNVSTVNPYVTTREQTKDYIVKSRKGELDQYTYFPVSVHTPGTVLATLNNAGIEITDKPLAMQAKKARQSQLEGQHIERDGTVIRHHALTPSEIQEAIDKLEDPIAAIYQEDRVKKKVEEGKTIYVPAPDNFVFFVTLDSGKEVVAVIEFDSFINKDMIQKDGQGDEYHTTVTVFEPDKYRDGEEFDYAEYLAMQQSNTELEIKKESPKTETAISQTQATVSESELSGATVAQEGPTVKRQYSLSDSNGKQLTKEQQEYFKDSVVRDEDGNLKVMYHGTSKGGFTVFDTYGSNYGLFGTGSYFTDSKTIAESYTNKGKGNNKQVYESYLNIKNPMDMDAQADPAEWAKAFPEADFPESGTNEAFYRAVEEFYADQWMSKWEVAEEIQSGIEFGMGYDGITHIGGGRVNPNGEKHRVYIAFQPEQIKNTDNTKPTDDADIRYSLSKDSDGNKLTKEQSEFFKDSKIVDNEGNLRRVYHTTKNDFTVFDKSRKGEATDGANTFLGFFFAESPDHMEQFPEFQNGKTDAYYLNMKKPMDLTNLSKEAFMDIVELTGGDRAEAAEAYDQELKAEESRARLRGDNNTSLSIGQLLYNMVGDYYHADFFDALKPNYDKLVAKGYDGVIDYLDEMIGEREFVVFDSNQAKLTSNTSPTTDADIRYSLSDPKTDKAYMDAVNRGDMETAQKMVEDAAKESMYTVRAYHGTVRGDRVGNVFLPERATSGPMAFFTDNREIAENYAKSKKDTSLAYDEEYADYYSQFRVNQNGKSIKVQDLWRSLPFGEKQRLKEAGKHITWDEDMENIVWDDDATHGLGNWDAYTLNMHKGNAIEALIDSWLESGELFGNEGDFLKVLDLAGIKGVEYRDPDARHEKVYDTFLKIQKPFDTATVDDRFVDGFEEWYNQQPEGKYYRDTAAADMWDKNSQTAELFLSRLRDDIENNTTYAWTSIPDSMTDYLKHLGHDGIRDTGGKFGGDGHSVWIPFTSEQIKSADPVTYDDSGNVIPLSERFNPEKKDIRNSLSVKGEVFAPSRNDVYGKDFRVPGTVSETERVAPVAENATTTQPVAVSEMETTTAEEMVPDNLAPVQEELDRLIAEQEDIRGAMEAMVAVGDYSGAEKLLPEYDAVTAKIAEIQNGEAERFDSITDTDAPPVKDAPFTESDSAPVENPFEDRDWYKVGNRKVKAYMYENPEVKPFFQDEALALMSEWNDTTRGEKWYNEELHYATGGAEGWSGVKRHTSKSMEILLDEWHMSYDDIKKGLTAIIEDHGAENIAAAKKIEFMLNDRLLNGYTDFYTKQPVPPNQDYINLLNEKQITEYYKEAFDAFMANADQYAPPAQEEDIAPVKQKPGYVSTASEQMKLPLYHDPNNVSPAMKEVQADGDIAPVFETESGQQSILPDEPVTSENAAATRKALHERIIDTIKTRFAERGFDFDAVLKKAKNLSTFATVDNTPQRVMEKALGYKEGGILSDITVNKVAQNESQGIKWLNSFTDRKNGLLAQISNQYHIKPGSKESAAAQMYAEGFYVNAQNEIIQYGDVELAADFPNAAKQAQIKGLARDPRIRRIYDETLKAINESRTRNAYPEIPRLDNYFLHFRAMNDTFSKLGLPFNPNDIRAKDLPTDLNGVTADLKPGQPFFASAMHREGKRTSFDLLGGLEQYLTSAKNQIYHIDDIQNLRALRNYIADTYGQANGLEGLDALSEEEQQQRIEQVYNSHLSTFAKFLNEEANVLAGKTALIDRGLEGIIGRRGMTFLDTVNRQVGANMVGYNISSSLTNLIAPVQAFAKTNKAAFIKGMAQFASNKVQSIYGKGDGFAEQSPVMIRRKGAERFNRTLWQKMSDPGYALMSAIDEVSTELIARTKYNEFVSKGMDSQQAHFEADKWVSRLMGDRSLGQQPQLYNSKMLGIVTKFQLEVRNQLDSQFYDTIQEAKVSNEDIQNRLLRNAKTAAKVTSTFFQLAVAQHLFGKAFESVAGYNPAFDIISAIIKAFGWDDDEESEDTVLDNLEQGFLELLEDLPYASTFTGGRIPISSALPVAEFIKGKDQYGNEKSRWETLSEAAPYYLLPGGYGQAKKTIQGLDMFSDDHPIAGSYTDSGNLRFPVEDNLANRAQAAIFGQYASGNARDYFDNERSALKPNQIQEFIDVGMTIQDYWKYRDGLSGLSNLEEKIAYINGLNLTTAQKNVLVNNLTDRKEAIDMSDYDEYDSLEEFDYANKNPEKYAFFEEIGITYETYRSADDDAKRAYDWAYENPRKYTMSKAISDDLVTYRQYTSELNDIRADKDSSGKTISGSAKAKKVEYINGLDLDYGQKIILFKSLYEADDTYNYEIVDYLNSREDFSYQDVVTILQELGFLVDSEGNVGW